MIDKRSRFDRPEAFRSHNRSIPSYPPCDPVPAGGAAAPAACTPPPHPLVPLLCPAGRGHRRRRHPPTTITTTKPRTIGRRMIRMTRRAGTTVVVAAWAGCGSAVAVAAAAVGRRCGWGASSWEARVLKCGTMILMLISELGLDGHDTSQAIKTRPSHTTDRIPDDLKPKSHQINTSGVEASKKAIFVNGPGNGWKKRLSAREGSATTCACELASEPEETKQKPQ